MSVKNFFRFQKISVLFMVYSTGIAMVAVVVVTGLFAWFELRRFAQDEERMRQQYIDQQKDLVKRETMKVVDYIQFTRMFLEEKMRDDLKNKTNQAWLLMENLYNQNRGRLTTTEIKQVIKDALRPVRYNNGRGYIFIVAMNGTEELFPVAPQFEGKNLLGLQDEKGIYVIRDEIDLIRKSDSGFVTDYWTKPGDNSGMIYPKTSYIRYFKPLDWYVGCGEYLDNVEKDMQQEALARIRQSKFDPDGYVFANTFDGYALVIYSDKYKDGDYVWDMTDAYGFKIIQEEVKVGRQPDGGFISYHWVRPGTSLVAPKISYFKSIEDWKWIIGAGVYLDEIEQQIASNRVAHRTDLYKAIALSSVAFISVLVLVAAVGIRISRRIRKNFSALLTDLPEAIDNNKQLDASAYSLIELKEVTANFNRMAEERGKVRRDLTESESRFRTLYENVPVMIAILDDHQNAVHYNNLMAQVFGFTDRRPISIDFVRTVLTDSPINQSFSRFAFTPNGEFIELELNTKAGIRSHCWAHFKSESGQVILVGYDVTELRENQRVLKELNDTKDKLFSIIAHDLRNPIGTLKTFLDELANPEEKPTPEEMHQFMGLLREMATRAFNLLENLLVWARSQRGSIEFNPSRVNLYKAAESVVELYTPAALEKKTSLFLSPTCNIMLRCDPNMLQVILRNLVGNSVKFTQNGEITVTCRLVGSMTEIAVSDTGLGMDAQTSENLFRKGTSVASRPGTRGEKGSALGLMLCAEFVDRHNGHIGVESQPGKGTTIRFTLPLHTSQQ